MLAARQPVEARHLFRWTVLLHQDIVRKDLAGGSVRQVVFLADENHLHPRARGVYNLVLSREKTCPAACQQQRHHQE